MGKCWFFNSVSLILIPASTLIQFISPDSMIQSGREFLVLLQFSEGVHPTHNKPYRKSSTSLTAVSSRFKNKVWATFETRDGEQTQAHNDSMPHIRYCCPPIQRNSGNNATVRIMPKLLKQNQYNYPLACPSRDFFFKKSPGAPVL